MLLGRTEYVPSSVKVCCGTGVDRAGEQDPTEPQVWREPLWLGGLECKAECPVSGVKAGSPFIYLFTHSFIHSLSPLNMPETTPGSGHSR